MIVTIARKDNASINGVNIDTCRIATQDDLGRIQGTGGLGTSTPIAANNGFVSTTHAAGRWPANLLVTAGAGVALDLQSGALRDRGNISPTRSGGGMFWGDKQHLGGIYARDSGGASRFFQTIAEESC